MPLSKDERNELFRAISTSSLNPAECEYKSLPDGKKSCILHAPSGSEFLVEEKYLPDDFAYVVDTRTGDEPYRTVAEYPDLIEMTARARDWANRVADWVKTPDLWEISRSSGRSVPGQLVPDLANTPFTAEEQKAISGQLRAIAETVRKDYALTAEQSDKLDEKFEEAEKASRRMGRKDWGLLFGGAVLSLILADVTTPGVAGHILMMIEHGLGHLFGGPPVSGVLSAGQD